MQLESLMADATVIGKMTDTEFADYWSALGVVVRTACQAPVKEAARDRQGEMSCTGAGTERARAWDHDRRRPAVANRLGFSSAREDKQ